MKSDITRRDFLRGAVKTTAGLGALAGLTFLPHPERVFGANDRVRVAVCGHHNTIGNIFYGSNGYLATGDEDASSYESWLGSAKYRRKQWEIGMILSLA